MIVPWSNVQGLLAVSSEGWVDGWCIWMETKSAKICVGNAKMMAPLHQPAETKGEEGKCTFY